MVFMVNLTASLAKTRFAQSAGYAQEMTFSPNNDIDLFFAKIFMSCCPNRGALAPPLAALVPPERRLQITFRRTGLGQDGRVAPKNGRHMTEHGRVWHKLPLASDCRHPRLPLQLRARPLRKFPKPRRLRVIG